MDGARFDRLTRALAKLSNRRALFAVAGVAAAGVGQRVATGSQLGPATCGSEGGVCTLLLGCCSGFTCVTSGTNTSYGVCVTGTGGMMPASSSLISPHSETIEQEVVALAETIAAVEADTSAADLQAARDARIAEIKARKDAKRSKRKTRLDTKRSNQQTRRDDQQARRRAAATATTPTPTPRTVASQTQNVDVSVICAQEAGVPQTVTVTNRRVSDINVAKLSSLLNLNPEEPYPSTQRIVISGTTLQLHFGVDFGDSPSGHWVTDARIFESSPLEGVRVELHSGEVYVACCDGTRICLGEPAAVAAPVTTPTPVPRKRKKDKNKSRQKKQKR